VSCQIDALERCLELRSLEKALVSLPETLDETYERILDSIPGENKQSAVRILQLLTYSERPLSVAGVVDAIAVDITEKPYFDQKYRMPDTDEILVYCSSLVVIVPRSVIFDDEYSDYESSDDICASEQHVPGKHMDPIFVLQLAHFSVKEYLTSDRFCGPLSAELHETAARLSIAVICLSYLLQLDRYTFFDKIEAEFPFAQYCAASWLHHAAAVGVESSELTGLIEHLLCYNQAAYQVFHRLYCPYTIVSQMKLGWQEPGSRYSVPALYYAAFGNLYTIVEFLIDHSPDINAKDSVLRVALHIASEQGHERIVQLLIDRGANVSAFGGSVHNALMVASLNGQTRVVQLLLGNSVDVNARGNFGQNALALAAGSDQEHIQLLLLLLEHGAYDTRGQSESSAVERVSGLGRSEAVELLLEKCADVYRQDKCFVNEALILACGEDQKRVVKLLLNKGADMYTAYCVWTLFHEFVRWDQEMAKTLLEGAYIALESVVPSQYGTVANFCARLGRTNLLRYIYKNYETDKYVSEPYGRTPLHLAVEGGHMETFEYLIALGADPTVLDAKGDGLLCYAVVGGDFEMVNAVLNKKLGSERYSIHWSPIHWACRAGKAQIVELLLEKILRSHSITTDELGGHLRPLDVIMYAGQAQMLERLSVTSRSLLGFHPDSERLPNKRFQIFNVCEGCQLVSSPEMRLDFVDIRVAVSWPGLPVSHMQ
jgi:ankyrin repeat protein